jgi:ankyrin repeat protein
MKAPDGYSTFMACARNGEVEKIREILIKKYVNVNDVNDYGSTALIIAASKGYVDIINELIIYGADLNVQNKILGSALMYAAANGHINAVESLISSGANVNLENEKGRTALDYAQAYGHQQIVKLLQSSGARNGTAPSGSGIE